MRGMKRALFVLLAAGVLAACGGDSSPDPSARAPSPVRPSDAAATISIARPTATPSPAPTPTPPQLCLVTRDRGVGPSYVPPDLTVLPAEVSAAAGVRMRQEAAQALLQLLTTARDEGHHLLAVSGYRSYDEQKQVLDQEIRRFGEAQAARQVAQPGHSEHQLGVAVDLTLRRKPYDLDQSFGGEPEGQWLAAHAPRFGFVVSYPPGKEAITGYVYEPWHIRYVGAPLAQQVLVSGLTLTEFLAARGVGGCPPGV